MLEPAIRGFHSSTFRFDVGTLFCGKPRRFRKCEGSTIVAELVAACSVWGNHHSSLFCYVEYHVSGNNTKRHTLAGCRVRSSVKYGSV